MNIKTFFHLGTLFLLLNGCTDTLDELTGTREKRRESAAFPLKEARTFFEEFMEQIPVTRSSKELESDGVSFPTGEFIPLWQQARQCEWGGIVFFDVPIEAQMDYRARRRVDYEDDLWLYQDVPVYQRLMVMRNVENQRDACYIVTFIPDSNTTSMADCERYMRDENYGYYSGVVLFIDFYTQRPLRVNRYKDGKLQGGVFLAGPLEEAVSRVRYAQQLVGELQIAQRRRIMTTRLTMDEIFGQFKGGELVKNSDGTWTFFYDGIYYTLKDTNGDGAPDTVVLDPVVVVGHRPDHSSSPIDSGFIPYPIDTIPPIYYYDLPEDPIPGSEGASDSTSERGGGTVGERGNGSSGWSVGGGSGSSGSTPTNTGTSTSTRLKDVHFDYPASKFPGYGTDGMDCYKLSNYILRQLMGAQTNVGDLSHAYFIKKKINGRITSPGETKVAFDIINEHLDAGRPIKVGVDYKDGGNRSDNLTDHWVVITGRGYDSKKEQYYFTFIETGRSKNKAHDAVSGNRLYYDPKQDKITGERRIREGTMYTVVQVRPNK